MGQSDQADKSAARWEISKNVGIIWNGLFGIFYKHAQDEEGEFQHGPDTLWYFKIQTTVWFEGEKSLESLKKGQRWR